MEHTQAKRVLVFIADGFEEIEALTPVDFLRRAGAMVETVSVGQGLVRRGAHSVAVTCDTTVEFAPWDADMLVLPGGMPGAAHLDACEPLKKHLAEFAKDPEKKIAAICAAPMVLGNLGLLEGRRATCYPGFEKYLKGANATGGRVEKDGNVITGRGPGVAADFALELVRELLGETKYQGVKGEIVG